jgi:hypothetical protein
MLSGNNINANGAKVIASLIAVKPLQTLHLGSMDNWLDKFLDNIIGDEGVKYLCEAIQQSLSLRVFTIESTCLLVVMTS